MSNFRDPQRSALTSNAPNGSQGSHHFVISKPDRQTCHNPGKFANEVQCREDKRIVVCNDSFSRNDINSYYCNTPKRNINELMLSLKGNCILN